MGNKLKTIGIITGITVLYFGITSYTSSGVKILDDGNTIQIMRNIRPINKIVYRYNKKTDENTPKEYMVLSGGCGPCIRGMVLWDTEGDNEVDGYYKTTVLFGKVVAEEAYDKTEQGFQENAKKMNQTWQKYKKKLKVKEKLEKILKEQS